MKVVWQQSALDDRLAAFDYLFGRNPQAALDLERHFDAEEVRLSAFPDSGRLGRFPGTREAMVPRTPYLLVYRVEGEMVRVLRVMHGARDWPSV